MLWNHPDQYEIDFLAVENENASKSGDAITFRFWSIQESRMVVVVVDAGYAATGESVVTHIKERYGTDRVDLAISTHPDGDHLNGLQTVLESLVVTELFIHRPRDHGYDAADYPNIEAVDNLLATAARRGTKVTEPFAGESRFGALTVLGPTKAYYEELLVTSLIAAASGASALSNPLPLSASARLLTKAVNLLERGLAYLPLETLGEDGVTSDRNNTSVITLVEPAHDERWLLTGDAGIPAMHHALDRYELLRGAISAFPMTFVQVPHHGSRRNVSPSLLDRWLGPRERPYASTVAYVSSAKADPKHPSPKVTNAFVRRSSTVVATEGISLWRQRGMPQRWDYGPVAPIGPLVEDD